MTQNDTANRLPDVTRAREWSQQEVEWDLSFVQKSTRTLSTLARATEAANDVYGQNDQLGCAVTVCDVLLEFQLVTLHQ